jgi:hypothetical protein
MASAFDLAAFSTTAKAGATGRQGGDHHQPAAAHQHAQGKASVGAWITNGSSATFGSTTLATLGFTTTGPFGSSTLVDGGDNINVAVGPPEPIPVPPNCRCSAQAPPSPSPSADVSAGAPTRAALLPDPGTEPARSQHRRTRPYGWTKGRRASQKATKQGQMCDRQETVHSLIAPGGSSLNYNQYRLF